MTMELVTRVVDTASPSRRPIRGDGRAGIGRPKVERPALALGVLLTAVKVALAGIAILVVFPVVMAAQVAIAR